MKYFQKSSLPVIIIAAVLASIIPSSAAMGWGAVVGTSEVHQLILNTAYDFLRRDNAVIYTTFPTIDEILANEGVTSKIFKTGPGPDGADSHSPWSEHWYNADSPGDKGHPPDSVARDIKALAQAIVDGETGPNSSGVTPGHSAAWGAHFLADVETSYHTNGTSFEQINNIYIQQGGANADEIILGPNIFGSLDFCYSALYPTRNFKAEIESFLEKNRVDPMADWFDPWYFNGATSVTCSHVLWEGFMGNITEIPAVNSYSSEWTNPAPSFTGFVENLSKQAAAFTKMAAENSRQTQMEGYNNPTECVHRAAQRVATLWRASYSGLNPVITVSVPDEQQPQKLKVTAIIKNYGYGNCTSVQAKLSLTGGVVLDGTTKDVDDFGSRTSSRPVSWIVEISDLDGTMLNVEVIYAYNQPDLQYAKTKYWTGKIEPPEETTTTEPEPEPKTTSVVILFNVSSQMGKITHTEIVPMVLNAMEALPDSVIEVAIYAYGEDPQIGDCSVWGNPFMTRQQAVDFANSLLNVKTETRGSAPLAKGITESGNYLKTQGKGDTKAVVLISNSSIDTCGGDPIQAAQELGVKVKTFSSPFVKAAYAADGDMPVSLQVIGVYVDTTVEEQGLRDLADAGGGQYFSVDNIDQMSGAIEEAIKAGESSSGSFFDKLNIQPWWYAVGGGCLLLFIMIMVGSRKRRAQPATFNAGVYVQPGQPANITAPPGIAAPPAAPPESKVLFCPKCGSQTHQGAVFCVRCGSTLEMAALGAAPGVQNNIFCPRCGSANVPGSTFCNKCGTGIQPSAAIPQNVAVKKNYWAWWLLIFLALPGGLIAWAALRKENPSVATRILMFGLFISMLIFYVIVQRLT